MPVIQELPNQIYLISFLFASSISLLCLSLFIVCIYIVFFCARPFQKWTRRYQTRRNWQLKSWNLERQLKSWKTVEIFKYCILLIINCRLYIECNSVRRIKQLYKYWFFSSGIYCRWAECLLNFIKQNSRLMKFGKMLDTASKALSSQTRAKKPLKKIQKFLTWKAWIIPSQIASKLADFHKKVILVTVVLIKVGKQLYTA